MTSSEDSADDFESADEDFDANVTDQTEIKTINRKEERNESIQDGPECVLQHLKTLKLEKCVGDSQVKDENISSNAPDDFKIQTPEPNNTQTSNVYISRTSNIVNNQTFIDQSQIDSFVCDVKKSGSPNTNPDNPIDVYVTLKKEASSKKTENIVNTGCRLEETLPTTEGGIPTMLKSNINDYQNNFLSNEAPSKNMSIGSDAFVAEDAELGDRWDLEDDDLETTSITDTTKTELKNLSSSKQGTANPNSNSVESWGGFNTENEDNFTVNPGDGWEVEEEDGFEIPITLSKVSDKSIQPSQEHQIESPHLEPQGWGGWSGWGVSSLLSTATGTVTTFSSHVTAGLSSVLETTVGAPDPENLATNTANATNIKDRSLDFQEEKQTSNYVGLGSIVSGVSFLSSTVINRGLDTLETLGKKTMEVLQEGDPGLMKKRAMLFPEQDKPVLSQILREAKEKADLSDKEKEEKDVARKVHFESLFDDYKGMVHLEALEMLSTQCDLKLQTLAMSQSGPQLEDLQETLSQVRDLCDLSEDDEDSEVLSADQFADELTKCVSGLKISMTAAKIIQVNNEVISRLDGLNFESAVVVHQTAISSLAEFTAAGMECFHKSAELLLAKTIRNTPDEADSYVQLTSHLCARVSAIANEFSQLLTKNHPIANSSMITNIFLEASNSSSYMKNACQLLIPVLQVGAVCT